MGFVICHHDKVVDLIEKAIDYITALVNLWNHLVWGPRIPKPILLMLRRHVLDKEFKQSVEWGKLRFRFRFFVCLL